MQPAVRLVHVPKHIVCCSHGVARIRRCRMRDATFSSKAYGTRESKEFTMDGRVMFDLMQSIQRDHKLSSYSLNSVSAHFLGEQKEDVHHSVRPLSPLSLHPLLATSTTVQVDGPSVDLGPRPLTPNAYVHLCGQLASLAPPARRSLTGDDDYGGRGGAAAMLSRRSVSPTYRTATMRRGADWQCTA
jgi:hypothetical protein